MALRVDEMLRISAARMFRSAHGARFDDRLQFHSGVAQNTVGHFELTANQILCGHPRASQAHRKHQIEGRSLHVWTFSLPISRRTDDDASLSGRSRRLLRGISSSFCVNPSLLLMTRFAHCNRIFAHSHHCSGVVSHALLGVLIAASPVQHTEAVLVGFALRCQGANATRNVPIWKGALVH